MISRIEYKLLKEVNEMTLERDKNQDYNNPLLKEYDGFNIQIRLKDRFRKISSGKFEKTILGLRTKNYIANENIYSKEFDLDQVSLTNDGKVELEDYNKNLVLTILKNFLISLLGSAFFSALFGWMFQLI